MAATSRASSLQTTRSLKRSDGRSMAASGWPARVIVHETAGRHGELFDYDTAEPTRLEKGTARN